MEVQVVRAYRKPNYPLNFELKDELKNRSRLPQRWLAKPLVLTALATAVMIDSGCSSAAYGCDAVAPPNYRAEDDTHDRAVKALKKEAKLNPKQETKAVKKDNRKAELRSFLTWLKQQGII